MVAVSYIAITRSLLYGTSRALVSAAGGAVEQGKICHTSSDPKGSV